jgi:hypothetical protein
MSTALPRYESHTSIANNRPHIVTIRPITTGGENANELLTRMLIADTVREHVTNVIRASTRWTNHEIDRRARGVFTGLNTNNPTRGVSRGQIRLLDITPNLVEEMFAQMVQSADNLLIYEIEWSFVINPRIFIIGGSSEPKKPKWVKGAGLSWKSYSDIAGPISCAAVALTLATDGVDKTPRNYARPNSGINRLKKDARTLQTQLGWDVNVGINELENFVLQNPKYRLTCLMPAERNFLDYTFTGTEFVEVQPETRANNTSGFTSKVPSPYYLYIYLDLDQKHYACVKAPAAFYSEKQNDRILFCHHCTVKFNRRQEHKCGETVTHNARYKNTLCVKCGLHNCEQCHLTTCYNCKAVYEKRSFNKDHVHRCIVMKEEKEDTGYNTGSNDGKKPSLWVYDLESRIQKTVLPYFITTHSPDPTTGKFTDCVEIISTTEADAQIPNMVSAINVFTKETFSAFGDDCINKFMTFILNHNGGNSILLAHNAAGYDTRLIFEDIIKRENPLPLYPTMNGCKFNELRIGSKIFFRDSRNHLGGSLKALGQDFGCEATKGHFPHLFNSIENYDYRGLLPDKKYYDLSSCKVYMVKGVKVDEYDDFHKWYDEESKLYTASHPWVMKEQLYEYNINDIVVLAEIVEKYHNIYMEKFKHSPWKCMTTSSYFHNMCKLGITRELELPEIRLDDKTPNPEYEAKIQEHSETKWAVLKGVEYAAAREALRGGRTGVGRIITELTPEQIARGCKIKYLDVVSLYPYHQIAHEFPCGIPTIHVFDQKFQPCYKHRNQHKVSCDCPSENRYSQDQKVIRIKVEDSQWSTSDILSDPYFHGFVTASLTPPTDMIHPILVHFDDDTGKCNATCEPLIEKTFTSCEFTLALQHGYKLDKIHRFDRYKMAAPLWEDFVKELYIFKLINSRKAPDPAELSRMIEEYETDFSMGDMIASVPLTSWGKNDAKKAAAKTGLNSGWGKHAQRPKLVQAQIINYKDEESRKNANTLFLNISKDRTSLKSGTPLGDDYFMYKFIDDGNEVECDLTNTYLPAASFVPAYGRIQLWEQLHQLGERVVMYDTDSVVFIHDPELYNPEASKLWGRWEEEDISVTGITGVICTGPKSYAMKCADSNYDVVKLKGISQTRATGNILNYSKIKKMILANIETGAKQTVMVPQTLFQYVTGRGIQTRKIFKRLSFACNEQKGRVGKNMVVYPLGYEGADLI